ncbi:MAG: hypothetical protein Q8N43_01095 [Candidatus Azambacteria bacterium]|nr:hypothetical protein [Candidatus Azambacteria bacterium]
MDRQIKIAIIIIIILVLGFGGYFAYVKYFSQKSPVPQIPDNNQLLPAVNNSTSTPKQNPSEVSNMLSGFKVYKNSDFGFEIQYPETWTVAKEDIVNVRGENTKGFFFKKPNSDLRFAILPRDGLSYGLPNNGTSEDINIGGFPGVQTKYIMPDGRRLLLVHPQTSIFNWDSEIGRLDIESSVEDPVGDFVIFNKMLNSFKLSK